MDGQESIAEKDEFEVKQEKLVEVTQLILQFCTSEYIVEGLIDISVPQIQEHYTEVVKTIPRRRFQHHTEE